MVKNSFALLPVLVFLTTSSTHAATWVTTYTGGDDSGGMIGTITLDDWGFVGPGGRLANTFEPVNGFGNEVFDTNGAAYCIANPQFCGIGQRQHVITSGPDGITPDQPRDIDGDLNTGGPFINANLDSQTTFYHWGYTTAAGSTFSNMLIDFDGDYHVAQEDMAFEFYNVFNYEQVVPEGGTRIGGIADGAYPNSLSFQPYALNDAKGWCGSVLASHPNAHEAMAGQVTFDVAFDVYFRLSEGVYSYMNTEVIPFFEMRSFGDLYINIDNSGQNDPQVLSARAVVNNTDPNVPNQSVDLAQPADDLYSHNKVSFMGGGIIPTANYCGIPTPEWTAGQRGPGITHYASIVPGISDPALPADQAACTAAGGEWGYNAFAGKAFILRADGGRFIDYFDESVYGTDPMTLVSDTDGDLIPDDVDNCILVPNSTLIPDAGGNSQLDTDGDGYGNMCDGDLNQSGYVDFADLTLFSNAFFSADADADMNGSGTVDFADLTLFQEAYFKPAGPSCCGIPLQ